MKALETKLTPEGFLLELMEALTDSGTLLLPALTYESVTPGNPFFSLTESEPCVGILPKTFMKMDGVLRSIHRVYRSIHRVYRSIHPTHSVCAWGANAEALTGVHINDNTPVGSCSPFMLLPEFDGKILFVGDILDSCTFMHGIEEIVEAPYAMNKEMTRYTITDAEGKTFEKDYYTHNFKGWEQEYTRIREILEYPDIRTGSICAAPCTLINPKKLKTAAIERFKDDIYAFVSPA
jgi:aminoglycoside 3-N-acetyltransferase